MSRVYIYPGLFDVVLILLLMLQVLLGGCGDDDHTDKWVGRWTLEMWNGENHAESLETSFKLSFLKAGGSVEEWDLYYHGYDSTTEFTFGDDSRWEFVQTGKPKTTSIWSDTDLKRLNAALAEVASKTTFLSTGSYIVTDDEFTMQGDKMNIAFKGRMSGLWKRSGSKLTLFGDDKSGLGAIVLSK